MRLSRWGCAAVLAVVSASATAPAAIPATAQTETTMRVAFTSDIDSLNPFRATTLVATQIGRLMYEFLTVNGAKDFSPEPGLAERWETSSDNLTWTFQLRKNMHWSDGQPITARDVEFTYNKIMTDPAAAAANGVAVTNYKTVRATDDSTVVITTRQPQASMLQSEIPIVPEHVWKDITDYTKFTNSGTFPVVGSGPFVLTGYQEGQSATLEANDKFWRGRPKIDKLRYVKYESTETAVQGLRKGDVDLAYRLTATQFNALRNDSKIKVNAGNGARFVEVIINLGSPKADGSTFGNGNAVLRDVDFRKALAHAVDVPTIIDKVKQGLARPASQIIPQVYPDWTFRPEEPQRRHFDLDKANSLLNKAGYARDGDGMRTDKRGKAINLRLLVTSDNADNRQIANYLKGWFNAIGLDVTIEYKSSNQVDEDTMAGNYDLAFSGWSVSPDPDFMLAQETCRVVGTALSDSNFCSVEYDRLYHQQQGELDKQKRMRLVQRAQSVLYENASALLLTYDRQLEAYRSDRYQPFKTQPDDGGVIANQVGYWSYYQATPTGAGEARSDNGTRPSMSTVAAMIGGAAVLLLGLLWSVGRRRKIVADDRE